MRTSPILPLAFGILLLVVPPAAAQTLGEKIIMAERIASENAVPAAASAVIARTLGEAYGAQANLPALIDAARDLAAASPGQAPGIAAAAAVLAPTEAPAIAAAVAAVAPSSAAAVATAVAQAVPSAAADVAGAVAGAVPSAAVDVAQSVAAAVPGEAQAIAAAVTAAAPNANAAAIAQAAQTGAESGSGGGGLAGGPGSASALMPIPGGGGSPSNNNNNNRPTPARTPPNYSSGTNTINAANFATATLNGVVGTVSGTAVVNVDISSVTVQSQTDGTINANAPGTTVQSQNGGSVNANAASTTVQSQTGGTFDVNAKDARVTQFSGGALKVNSGDLRIVDVSPAGQASSLAVTNGELNLGGNNLPVSSQINLAGGTVANGALSSSNGYNLSGGVSASASLGGTGGLQVNGNATLSGSNSFQGSTLIATNGHLILSNANALSGSSAVTNNGDVTVNNANTVVGAFTLNSGSVRGEGSLTSSNFTAQSGLIDTMLNGASLLVTNSGTNSVVVGRSNALAGITTNTIAGGSTLDIRTFDQNLGTNGRLIILDEGKLISGTNRGASTITVQTFEAREGEITVNLVTTLVKTNAGTVTLKGTNYELQDDLVIHEGSLRLYEAPGGGNPLRFDPPAKGISGDGNFTVVLLADQAALAAPPPAEEGRMAFARAATSATNTFLFNFNISGKLSVTIEGEGDLVLGGSNTSAGSVNIAGGNVTFATNTTLPLGGGLNLSGGSLNIGTNSITSTNTNFVVQLNGGTIAGSGTLDVNVQLNSGTFDVGLGGTNAIVLTNEGSVLVLGKTNTYSGQTLVTNGASLVLGIDAALSTESTNFVVSSNSTLAVGFRVTNANAIFTNTNVVLESGAFIGFDTTGGPITTNFAPDWQTNQTNLGFAKLGSGTLTLTGTNNYTGGTRISGGTLLVGNDGALPTNGNVTLTGGTLDVDTNNPTLGVVTMNGGRIDGSGTITSDNTNGYLFIGGTNTVNTSLGGTAGVNVTYGTVTFTTNSTNVYSGTTTISGGSLFVEGNQSGATNAVTVAAGATLGGKGTIGGATTIAGFHHMGASQTDIAPGIQTFTQSLTYQSGAQAFWRLTDNTTSIGTAGNYKYDRTVVGTSLNVANAASITFNLSFNALGSTVDWTDDFWRQNHEQTAGWLVYDASSLNITGLPNLNDPSQWIDSNQQRLNTVHADAIFAFYLDQASSNVYLNYIYRRAP